MFRNRLFALSIVALLAFSSFVQPAVAAPALQEVNPEIAYTISGNAGVADVVLTWDDAGVKTTTADSNGDYTINVSSGWSGTVTPSLSGYEFTPTNRVYSNVVADDPAEDYTALAVTPTPTITSTITNTPTITITRTNTRTKTKTPTKTLTPTITQTLTKSPTPTTPSGFSKSYPWNGVSNISYSTITLTWNAYSPTPTKYRYCIDTSNDDECSISAGYTSVSGKSITLGNFSANTTYYWHVQAVICTNSSCTEKDIKDSNSGDWWSFSTGSAPTKTPTKTRTPTKTATKTSTRTPTKTFTVTPTVTPTATLVKFTISGNTGVAGATLSYTDGSAKTATSNGSGAYSFAVSYNWTGVVTVSRSGYTFADDNTSYTNVLANQTNQNYTPDQTIHTISGNAGTTGVTLSFNDGAAQTTTSNSSGDYSVLVPDNWTGSVTPSKSGVTFNPANHSYVSLMTDQTAQDFVPTNTYTSIGTQDGWILESTETSGVGGTMNSAATSFQLGDDISNRQYRVILSFATGSLPDNAVIQSAVLKIKQNGSAVGVNPFTVLGSLWADIRQGNFGGAALELADFNSTASGVAGFFGNTPVSGWYSLTLNSTGRSYINRAGGTQFRLRFGTDDNNNGTADYMKFISGDFTSNQPQLVIVYSVP